MLQPENEYCPIDFRLFDSIRLPISIPEKQLSPIVSNVSPSSMAPALLTCVNTFFSNVFIPLRVIDANPWLEVYLP